MQKSNIIKFVILSILLFLVHAIIYKPAKKTYNLNIINETKNCFLIDDFKKNLNNKHWNLIDRGNNYNNELQYYHPKNVYVDNDNLVITASLEEYNNHKYTSGSLNTKNKFEFLYGKIIFRVKPPKGDGLLSAIWLLPADDSLFPEIDIIEVLGERNEEIWSGVHYLDNFLISSVFETTKINEDDFFIYELVWEKDEIRGYINNNLVYKTNKGIPDKKMFLLINLAVGGNWPKKVDDNIFPRNFLIDYVIIMPKECEFK